MANAKPRRGSGCRRGPQRPDRVGVEPLRSERGDWLFGMGYWFVALLRPACAGLGPLRPTPAHSQMSLRDGMDVRLRGGIQRAPATGGWEWGSRIRGTRHRMGGTRSRALSLALFMVGSQEEEVRKALKEKDISGGGERDRMMVSAT